jgi:hypothetical protein
VVQFNCLIKIFQRPVELAAEVIGYAPIAVIVCITWTNGYRFINIFYGSVVRTCPAVEKPQIKIRFRRGWISNERIWRFSKIYRLRPT